MAKVDVFREIFSLSCAFVMEEDGFTWSFSRVYGPVDDDVRGGLWEELSGVKERWSLHWCVAGDFNVVRFLAERSSEGAWTRAMMHFSDFIDGHQLIDLPLEGASFTWSSGREIPTLSRLDRFLISGDWEEKFPDIVQAVLTRVTSDHIPLVLDCGGLRSRCTPFRFESMWLRVDNFQGLVRSWWEENLVVGTSSFILAGKLHILKNNLKRWNKEVFGSLEWRKNRALADIAEIDRLEGECVLSESQHSRRAACQAECVEIAVLEEISWLLTTEEEVRSGIVSFYQKLYSEPLRWRPRLDDLHFDSISTLERDGLENPFSEEEVLKALKSC
ncbi:uncharacterized protein LOC132292248 [Cornus florida]|uniref:uncharacterized protein LOC132292248 n=1 Tax=Cornus florida TaxID=4283 RepID=UPI0028962CA9|nr:uncharacterized protein LOC132292248 [Cornus florida]